ncbi:MAG: hypothetical protein WC612_05140 [Bdellovibrionales bacterium]|jgi:hypothetical protein
MSLEQHIELGDKINDYGRNYVVAGIVQMESSLTNFNNPLSFSFNEEQDAQVLSRLRYVIGLSEEELKAGSYLKNVSSCTSAADILVLAQDLTVDQGCCIDLSLDDPVVFGSYLFRDDLQSRIKDASKIIVGKKYEKEGTGSFMVSAKMLGGPLDNCFVTVGFLLNKFKYRFLAVPKEGLKEIGVNKQGSEEVKVAPSKPSQHIIAMDDVSP